MATKSLVAVPSTVVQLVELNLEVPDPLDNPAPREITALAKLVSRVVAETVVPAVALPPPSAALVKAIV